MLLGGGMEGGLGRSGVGHSRRGCILRAGGGAAGDTVAETAEDHEEEHEAEEAGDDGDGDADSEVRAEPGEGGILDASSLATAREAPAAVTALAAVDKVGRQDDAVRPPRRIHTGDLAVRRRTRWTRFGQRERQPLRLTLLVPTGTHPRRTLQALPTRATLLAVVCKLIVRAVHIRPRASLLLVAFGISGRPADLL